VREWKHFADGSGNDGEERYFAGVAALANWLVTTHDVEVTFLSSCQGIPDYWTDDAATARRVVARLDPAVAARVTVDGVFRDPAALQATLGTFDLVVATRMHVAILALCAGCPVLPIAYEFKTTELFKRLRLAWLAVPIEEATADGLISRAERLLREWPAVRETLASGVQGLTEELQSTVAVIRRFSGSITGSENSR
jgi:colanic acid/amylovoran biosynthesis protein